MVKHLLQCPQIWKKKKNTDNLILGPSTSLPRTSSRLPRIVLSVCRSLRVIYCLLINPNGIVLAETVFLLMLTQSSLSCIRLVSLTISLSISQRRSRDTCCVLIGTGKSREVSPGNSCCWYENGKESWKLSQNFLFIDYDNMGIPTVLGCVSVTCPLPEGTG